MKEIKDVLDFLEEAKEIRERLIQIEHTLDNMTGLWICGLDRYDGQIQILHKNAIDFAIKNKLKLELNIEQVNAPYKYESCFYLNEIRFFWIHDELLSLEEERAA